MAKATITVEEVAKIGKLAKLDLSTEELIKFSKQLTQILDYVGQLEKVDVGGVTPTTHINQLENVTRLDTVSDCLTPASATGQGAKVHDHFFVVDAVIDNS